MTWRVYFPHGDVRLPSFYFCQVALPNSWRSIFVGGQTFFGSWQTRSLPRAQEKILNKEKFKSHFEVVN
jgi:hypothetical protein